MKVTIKFFLAVSFFVIFTACLNTTKRTFKIDSSQVKSIVIRDRNNAEAVIKDESEIEIFLTMVNDNKQILTKFLPTVKADIALKNDSDTISIMFRDRYLKVTPGGGFKMKKSIDEILRIIGHVSE